MTAGQSFDHSTITLMIERTAFSTCLQCSTFNGQHWVDLHKKPPASYCATRPMYAWRCDD